MKLLERVRNLSKPPVEVENEAEVVVVEDRYATIQDLFTIYENCKCLFCGHGPIIKYEPEQFKCQCWCCGRIIRKEDVYYGSPDLLDRARWHYSTKELVWVKERLEEDNKDPYDYINLP